MAEEKNLRTRVEHGCRLSFRRGGETLAVVTIGRERESLESELAMVTNFQNG